MLFKSGVIPGQLRSGLAQKHCASKQITEPSMNLALKYYRSVVIAILALAITACQQEIEPDPVNTGDVDPDEASDYLVFTDGTKITGNLPAATDGQLKINFSDSIYLVKDFKLGARVVVRHDGLRDITGFFVGVRGSSFYFDVSVSEAEAGDSTDVFYLNIDIPSEDVVVYPFTLSIKILPHGLDNIPVDEFDKLLTIEDPETDTCPITLPGNGEVQWEWNYSVLETSAGEILYSEAPLYSRGSSLQTGGCCNDNGTSSTVANDPYCFEKFSDGTPNPRWRSIQVKTLSYWTFDYVWFYEDGTFAQFNAKVQTNYIPSLSDFCAGVAHYDYQNGDYVKSGTYQFTSPHYINITYNITNPPVFGKTISSGEIVYTCHMLGLTNSVEGLKKYSSFVKVKDPQEDSFFTKDYVRYD